MVAPFGDGQRWYRYCAATGAERHEHGKRDDEKLVTHASTLVVDVNEGPRNLSDRTTHSS